MMRAVLSVQDDAPDAEIIVVDDCSDVDLFAEYGQLAGMGVRVFRQEVHRGGSAARNRGICEATGTHVSFLDSDDVWLPRRQDRIRRFYAVPGNQQAVLVSGALLHVDGTIRKSHQPAWRPGRSLVEYIYRDRGRVQTSMLTLPLGIARGCPWNEELRVNQDADLGIRLDRAGIRFHIDQEPGVIKEESVRPDRLTTRAETADLSYAWYQRESGDWSPAVRSGYHLQDRVWRLADSGRRREAFMALARSLSPPVFPRETARRAFSMIVGPRLYAQMREIYRSRLRAPSTPDAACQAAEERWRDLNSRARALCDAARSGFAGQEREGAAAGDRVSIKISACAMGRTVKFAGMQIAGLLLAGLLLVPAPARAQQHEIAAGETLEISVFRVPELTREVVVDLDGQIAFPPLGLIPAAGMTVPEIASLIQERLAGLAIMMDAQVTVGLRAVRPVVIGGDIANPGAIPFERGLTVRRAIALAGGIGVLRPSMGEAAEIRAERDAIAAELLGRRVTLARARAELAGADDLSPRDVPSLAGIEQAAVLTLANSLLDAAGAESEAQKAYLTRDLQIIENRIDRLGEQSEHQKALVDQQAAEVARYTDMQNRGLTPQARVSEEYRTLNELRSNLAETEAYITDVGRERESALHELSRHDDRRAAALEAEIQTALTEVAALEARMQGFTAQLAQLGLAGKDGARVTLYRVTDGQENPIPATEGTLLQPGDLVEVELPDSFYGIPQPAGIASAALGPATPSRVDPPAGPVQQRATP